MVDSNMVFISYKHGEADEFVAKLKNDLAAHFLPWSDHDIKPGEEWKPIIDSAVKGSFAVIVMVTPEAMTSPYVTYEWSFAKGLDIPVIPLMVLRTTLDEIHPKLNDIQYIDFTDTSQYGHKFPELVKVLTSLHNPKADDGIQRVIDSVLNKIHECDDDDCLKEIQKLEELKNERGNNALAWIIENAGLPFPRIAAAIKLGEITEQNDLRALPGLHEALSEGQKQRRHFQNRAVDLLSGYASKGNKDAIQMLNESLKVMGSATEQGRNLRKNLSQLAPPESVPYLIVDMEFILQHGGDWSHTIEALGKIGDEAAVEPLAKRLKPEKAKETKIAAAKALGKIGGERAIQALVEFLKIAQQRGHRYDDEVSSFNAVLASLREIGNLTVADALQELMESDWYRLQADQYQKQDIAGIVQDLNSKLPT